MSHDNLWFAFTLTALAGLSTAFGSAIALFFKHTNRRFLALSLGLSAGVMIYVSFVEILPEAIKAIGDGPAVLSFFVGMIMAAAIDRLVPAAQNPHELKLVEAMDQEAADAFERRKMMRMGVFTALAIGIHNFPEGFAAFGAALSENTSPAAAISIAIAIAIHNIPEGISVAVPIYQATGSRKKAFWFSALSGLAEPVGALVGYGVIMGFASLGGATSIEPVLGALLGGVAGIMVFISLDELFPAAREHGQGHVAIYGTMIGMAIMAVSLLLLD